jgi:magnesium-transporting ATPase (P-type)
MMERLWDLATKPDEEVLSYLKSSKDGLSDEEAERRLNIYGLNKIAYFKIDIFEIIKNNLFNFFNVFLLIAGILSLLINGPEIETILIFIFLFGSILVAIIQDYRANKLTQKLLSYFKNYAFVKRGGEWKRIDAEKLVPGDYVKVSAGFIIPADIRILKAEDAFVDESIITGESEPVFKTTQVNYPNGNRINYPNNRPNDKSFGKNSSSKFGIDSGSKHSFGQNSGKYIIPENIALMGTTLIKGEIEGIVFATGKESYFGSVAKKTLEIEKETAYQKMMTNFAKDISFVALFMALLIILLNFFKPNYLNFKELVIFAIVLAVAIVPEFLPTMTILSLSLTGHRLAKRGLVVKRLSSIEDLGAIEILCTDKTGTITTNELRLERIITEEDLNGLNTDYTDTRADTDNICPNRLPESSDRIDSTRITRPNNNYPNKRPNGNETFVQNSGNSFGQYSGSENIFGQHSGKVFGQDSGSVDKFSQNSGSSFGPHSGKVFGQDSGNNLSLRESASEEEFIKYFLADYYLTGEMTPYEKAILETLINADFTRTNTDSIYPNNNRINHTNKRPNNESFGHNSGKVFGQNSGNNVSLHMSASSLRKSAYKNFELIEDFDFDPITRIRKMIVRENGEEVEIIKGAPENVLNYIFYPNKRPNNIPEYKPNENIHPNDNRINYPNNRPNGNEIFGQHSGKVFGQDSGNDLKFGHNSGNEHSFGQNSGSKNYNYWLKIFENEDKNGYRTLALGIKKGGKAKFLGIASFFDPLKETAFTAIRLAKSLNLEIKILTGDSLNVARKVALELGIIDENEKVVLGEEIRGLNDEEARKIIKETKVFARVLPEDKLRIIKLLQKEKFVGFLGEGINDAPALKVVNVALAVDNASDVVKQEADIILKEKDLKTIVEGIYEGRKVLENLGKYIKHTMSDNFGNLISVSFLTIFLPFVPMTPLQVLLTNFLTDIPLIAFATDNVKIQEIKKPIKISGKYLILLLFSLGFVAGITNILAYLLVKNEPTKVIRTFIFFITTLTGLLVAFLIRTKNWFLFSRPSKAFTLSAILGILLTFIFVFLPPFKEIFEFSSFNAKLIINTLILILLFTIGTELAKRLFYKKYPEAI